MSRKLQLILHVVGIGLGSYAAVATGTPIPLVVTGGIQAVLGAAAQAYNTDGTPQSQPFQPGTPPLGLPPH